MEYSELTVKQIEQELDDKKIEHKGVKKRQDLLDLLHQAEHESELEAEAEPEQDSVVSKFKKAVKTTKIVEKQEDDPYSYLDGRNYDQLSYGEKQIAIGRSQEYQDVDGGIKAKVTDRLVSNLKIITMPDGNHVKFTKGTEYSFSQDDLEFAKTVNVEVKTLATKDKCCGGAEYEQIPLLEVVNG